MRVVRNQTRQTRTGCIMSKEGPRSVDAITLKELQAFDAWLHECSRKVRKSINEIADAGEDLLYAFHKASLEKGRAALSTFVRSLEDSHAKFCEGNPYQEGDLKTRHVPFKDRDVVSHEKPASTAKSTKKPKIPAKTSEKKTNEGYEAQPVAEDSVAFEIFQEAVRQMNPELKRRFMQSVIESKQSKGKKKSF
jgi:hypothetical protein